LRLDSENSPRTVNRHLLNTALLKRKQISYINQQMIQHIMKCELV